MKIAAVLLLLAVAALVLFRAARGRATPGERGFFFDASANRIFTAARHAAPPIRGVDGPEEDGFRALVISTNGHPEDRDSWQVAYLERFSPELKKRTEEAQATGESLAMGRLEQQAHRFVRRPSDSEWVPMNDPQSEVILTGWAKPGPNGVTPVVCTP